jgi:hypothetical protein
MALLPRKPRRLSGNCSAGMMMAYALRYGEQEILYGSVRRRMALHPPASAQSRRARTPQLHGLRAIQAIPHEKYFVYHPGAEVYSDPEGNQVTDGVRAVILDVESPGGATRTRHVYPSTRTYFRRGMRVAWEWNLDRVFGESWYQDPDTNEVKHGWSSSAEFIGRPLEEL